MSEETYIAHGKTHVKTEDCDALAVVSRTGRVRLPTGTECPVFRVAFSIPSATTNQSIVAAQDGFLMRPVALRFLCGATATTLVLNSKASGSATAISETFAPSANGGMVIPRNDDGVTKDTLPGEGITGTTGTGSTMAGFLHYIKIPLSEFSLDNAGGIVGWNDGSPYIG